MLYFLISLDYSIYMRVLKINKLVKYFEVVYMQYLKALGLRIKKQRIVLGYTQKEVVDLISKYAADDEKLICEKQLSRIERGLSGTTIGNYRLLFKALEKTPNYFMLGISDTEIYDNRDMIRDINEYLKFCKTDDVKRILLIAKAFSNNNEEID